MKKMYIWQVETYEDWKSFVDQEIEVLGSVSHYLNREGDYRLQSLLDISIEIERNNLDARAALEAINSYGDDAIKDITKVLRRISAAQ